MSRHRRFFIVILLAVFCQPLAVVSAAAADWSACKTAQSRLLRLERAGRNGKPALGHRSRASMRREVDQLDTWLWKNCRSHSRELRELERQRL
jgi:hypothetical protein